MLKVKGFGGNKVESRELVEFPKLNNKPLVEAIFELRWALSGPSPEFKFDPHYKLLIGRIFEKIKSEYPYHEQLPSADMPDEMAGYVVQHRFRKGQNQWPLIQIGPGIITLNETDGYLWVEFERRINGLVQVFLQTYPEARERLQIEKLMLRYIDGIALDSEEENILDILDTKLKTKIDLYPKLFEGTNVAPSPLGVDLRFSFAAANPDRMVRIRFVKAKLKDRNSLIWETIVDVASPKFQEMENGITEWVKHAHNLTHDWFFKLIEGDLLRRFQ